MKTMKKDNEIVRVFNDEAKKYLRSGYFHCSKSEWKKQVRDRKPEKTEKPKEIEEKIKSGKLNRHSKKHS
jgi:hypothetical protein